MELLPKLRQLAGIWVDYHGRTDGGISLRTLGVRAVRNAKLFDRTEMTVGTYERVVAYLADAKNWPLATIPVDAKEILDQLPVEAGR